MKIKIAERLKPYSHTPGASCIIPGTCSVLQAFPTLLRFDQIEFPLKFTGPVEGFTVQLDLEKKCVWVFGKAREGYFRIQIGGSDSGFDLYPEKIPAGVSRLEEKHRFHLEANITFHSYSIGERLSLGSHKAQDWDRVITRRDLKEILPPLYRLGLMIPPIPPQQLVGTAQLLNLPKDRLLIEDALKALFQAGFHQIMVPRLVDDQHQGFIPHERVEGNRFFLLQETAKIIRSLFFQQNKRRIKILPQLPISLDCGRFIDIFADGIGTIHFEWSKKIIQFVIISATTSGEVLLELQKEIKTFRICTNLKQRGSVHSCTEPLILEAGKTYYLDHFQK